MSTRRIRTLKIFIVEACFYFIMFGMGETFFSPFALFLHATPLEIGILSTLPFFIGALAQIFCPSLIQLFHSRKRFIVTCAILQALTFIPIMNIQIFPSPVISLILWICIYQTLILIHVPAWNSWISDILKPEEQTDYFGFHKRISLLSAFLALLASGPLLMLATRLLSSKTQGFCVLFSIAMAARLISSMLMTQQDEPPLPPQKHGHSFLKNPFHFLKNSERNKLIGAITFTQFAAFLSVPFFYPFQIENLGFSPAQFSFSIAAFYSMRIVIPPVWSQVIEKFGNKAVLFFSTLGMATLPFLWLPAENFFYILLVQVFSGIFWSGFDLVLMTSMLSQTSREERAEIFTIQQITSNLAMVLGSVCGGLLLNYFGKSTLIYHAVFLLSGILRLLGSFFITRIKIEAHLQRLPLYRFPQEMWSAFKGRGITYVPSFLRKENP